MNFNEIVLLLLNVICLTGGIILLLLQMVTFIKNKSKFNTVNFISSFVLFMTITRFYYNGELGTFNTIITFYFLSGIVLMFLIELFFNEDRNKILIFKKWIKYVAKTFCFLVIVFFLSFWYFKIMIN